MGLAIVLACDHWVLPRAKAIAVLVTVAVVLLAVGVWAAGKAEDFFGRTDPGQIVLDEVVGQILTVLLIPSLTWKWLLGGLLLFRALDVLKPFPARQAERIPRGWGIMLDDVIAGVYGLVLLSVIRLVAQ